MRVQLCGVRGSTPAPGPEFVRYGGNTSCVAFSAGDDLAPTLILDAGTGLRQVTPLLNGEPFRGTIVLSHLHWDHVQGLPFFAGGDTEGAQVRLLMPEQPGGAAAEDVFALSMSPPHFPIGPSQLRGHWTSPGRTDTELDKLAWRLAGAPVPVVVAAEREVLAL